MSPSKSEAQRRLFGTALSMKRGNTEKTETPAGDISSKVSENKIREFAKKPLAKEEDDVVQESLLKTIDNFISKKMHQGQAFAAATMRAKKMGYKDFSVGGPGRAIRDKMAQEIGKKHGVKVKTTWKMEKGAYTPDMPTNQGVWKAWTSADEAAEAHNKNVEEQRRTNPREAARLDEESEKALAQHRQGLVEHYQSRGQKVLDPKGGGYLPNKTEKGDKGKAIGAAIGAFLGDHAEEALKRKFGKKVTKEASNYAGYSRNVPVKEKSPIKFKSPKKKVEKSGTENLSNSKFSFSKELPNIADDVGSPTSGKMVKQKIDRLCKSIENMITHGGKI